MAEATNRTETGGRRFGNGPPSSLSAWLLALCLSLSLQSSPALAQTVDLVRVHKADRRLELLAGEKVLRTFPVALGGAPVGHKHRQGDERTPEGRYVLDWRNAASGFHKSIHIDYPNADDRRAARSRNEDPGGMIMIHGQKNGFGWAAWLVQELNWTDGCIALTNGDMDEVWGMVKNGTPIEILP
ncbi:MAG: L,D-transpeptidase family protein [Nitratireductor sp.]|nr:L,D-transpeptidase family protein [Nitratireductor sp.]